MTWPSSRHRHLAVTGLMLLLLLGLHGAPQAAAQSPTCPPGFVWQRMSGVGCVQEGCLDIPNAKYTYTNACSCIDGYKGCFEPVDYTGFDRKKCDPFCPVSRLVACVAPDADCPGQTPASPTAAAPAAPTAGPPPTASANPGAAGTASSSPSIDDLVRDLEQFLAGAGTRGPSAGQSAAAGAALSALIAAWVLINLLSGGNLADLLRAVGIVQQRGTATVGTGTASAPTGPTIDRIYDGTLAKQHINKIDPSILSGLRALRPDAPGYRDKVQQVLDKVKTKWVDGKRIKGIAYDWKTDASGRQVLDEDSIAIVVEEPEYPAPPKPAAPPPPAKAPAPAPAQPPPKPPGVVQIYQSDPSKFRRCQDMVYAHIHKRAPPSGTGQDKTDIYREMARQGFWEVSQGGLYDRQDAEKKLGSLREGDIIMFGMEGLPDESSAPHYAVVEGGKIHQILNMPQRGEYLAIDVKDATWFLRQRQHVSQVNGKTWNLKPYYGFKIFRPPP